jgi:dipeptidyl aminopeptidase/acylaminoacyl peptidase
MFLARCSAAIAGVLFLAPILLAQQPRMLAPEEYARWEQLAAQRTPLSPDGKWLVYGINRASRQNELRVQPSTGGNAVTIAFGEQPAFSDDSRWLAALVGMSEEDEARLRKDKKPIRKKLALVDLTAGGVTNIEAIESFSFSATGTHLAMRHYAPETPAPSEPAPGTEPAPKGTTLVVRELSTGRDTTFGSVSEMAWQHRGSLLAFAVTVDGAGNSVQLFDTATGTLRTLDSSSSFYAGLAWRRESASLAVLKSSSDEGREGPAFSVLAWPDVAPAAPTRRELASRDATLGADLRVVRFRSPQWSEDGERLFVGLARWRLKPVAPDASTRTRRVAAGSENPDELPDVQVWHPKDVVVMPRQKLDASRERERSMLASWNVASGRLTRLSTAIGEEVTPIKRSARALVIDTNAFAMSRSIGRVTANVSIADVDSGARTPVAERVEDFYVQASPGGKHVLYLKADHYWIMDVATGKQTNLTATLATSFVDKESDDTVAQKPAFGVAGWSAGDESVLLYDKLDIWEIKADGSGATRLTNGAAGEIRHRYVRLDPEEDWVDRGRPLIVTQFGLRSKKSGLAKIAAGPAPAVEPLVLLDKRVDRLAKARRADRYVYAVQAFDDSPDYFSAGASLTDGAQVTTTNPFMRDYAWGRSVVIDYKSQKGVPLQAGVFYPAGYDPSKKYPMVVYMYERLSDNVHAFSMPSERSYYNAAAFTTRGYVYLEPDIVFRPRDPGMSVVESVLPAVQRVIEMGLADPARVGIVGHSWGGFDTVYLSTHTNTFKAGVAGAPITDLVSNYGNHHWSSGIAETDHIETGQQRMQVPLYEDLPAYIRNSALYKVHAMQTNLLVMFGDNDGTVQWHQGVAMYNVARRAGKNLVMLQYGGEDHGLRKRQNQIDYHHRIFEWFDHYLKDATAPSWITDGERYLDRERDLQERKITAKPSTRGTGGR